MEPEDEAVQMHLLREHEQSPVGTRVLYKLLLDCLKSRDIRAFRSLVEQSTRKRSTFDPNYTYSDRSDETCLDIACRAGFPEFVEFLLQKGANVNRINEAHNRAPIHFATEDGHIEVLKILFKEDNINPNLIAGQRTALHIAVKNNDIDCAEILLKNGASPNIPNNKNVTALHLAASRNKERMVNLIVQQTKHSLDLDSYKDYNNQTTRDILTKKFPQIPLPPKTERGVNFHDLRYYLNANDEPNFLKNLKNVKVDSLGDVEQLMEMAAVRGFYGAVVELLNQIQASDCNLLQSATLALQQGHRDIFRELLHADEKLANKLIINACSELGMPGRRGTDNMDDRLECLRLILDHEDVDVRCTDSKGNTPLHYAARAGCREAITLLLDKGSYIGQMNNFNVPPLADIPATTLSEFFDNCLKTQKERTDDYEIEFNYKCLMPHEAYSVERKSGQSCRREEMETLRYIAGKNRLKHLLKHPLLSSFLYLKWHRIRYVLYANFAFYVIFYLLLNAYILRINYYSVGEAGNETNEVSHENVAEEGSFYRENGLRVVTAIFLFLLIVRETLQLLSSPFHYICSFENWLEMALIVLGIGILNGGGPQLGAVAILLSAWELVILIGQHPRMSTGIEMFKTVSLNFMRFLFLYAFLILAFALAFFTLFKDGDEDNNFPDPGHSLFKTIIMLTGEFDANDIPFVSHPVLSHCVFVLFVFLIAIVLFNLLNGLAVSDTADILGKAELIGLISRTRLVDYIESVAVGTPVLRRVRWSCWRLDPLAYLAGRILLFPSVLKDGKLVVKPHICFDAGGSTCYGRCANHVIDPRIVKQAEDVHARKGRLSDNERIIAELEMTKERLLAIEVTLDAVKRALRNNNNVNISEDNEAQN